MFFEIEVNETNLAGQLSYIAMLGDVTAIAKTQEYAIIILMNKIIALKEKGHIKGSYTYTRS